MSYMRLGCPANSWGTCRYSMDPCDDIPDMDCEYAIRLKKEINSEVERNRGAVPEKALGDEIYTGDCESA